MGAVLIAALFIFSILDSMQAAGDTNKTETQTERKESTEQKKKELQKMKENQEIYDKLQTECYEKCEKCNVIILCDDRAGVPKCSCVCKDCASLDGMAGTEQTRTEPDKDLESLFAEFCGYYEERCYAKYVTVSSYVRFVCDDRDGQWKSSCIAEGARVDTPKNPKH
jgi:hypothetical protein